MVDYKIILIENQITQFNKIISLFRYGIGDSIKYNIFPNNRKDYIIIMDNIRVALNKYYKDYIRQIAMSNIIEEINNYKLDKDDHKPPDAFIIDHKLVGCHFSQTGIDLAKELRKYPQYSKQPIMFLSRTLYSDESVMNEIEGLKDTNYIWIDKGYAGKDILQDKYFEDHVLKVIPNLLNEQIEKSIEQFMIAYFNLLNKFILIHSKEKLDGIDALKLKFNHLIPENEDFIIARRDSLENLYKQYENDSFDLDIKKVNAFLETLKNLLL